MSYIAPFKILLLVFQFASIRAFISTSIRTNLKLQLPYWKSKDRNLILLNHFESLLQKKIEIIYPILSLFHSKFMSIFSNNYFSIQSNPLTIILNLVLSLFPYKFTSIFSNTYFSIPYNPSLIYQCQSFFISLSN